MNWRNNKSTQSKARAFRQPRSIGLSKPLTNATATEDFVPSKMSDTDLIESAYVLAAIRESPKRLKRSKAAMGCSVSPTTIQLEGLPQSQEDSERDDNSAVTCFKEKNASQWSAVEEREAIIQETDVTKPSEFLHPCFIYHARNSVPLEDSLSSLAHKTTDIEANLYEPVELELYLPENHCFKDVDFSVIDEKSRCKSSKSLLHPYLLVEQYEKKKEAQRKSKRIKEPERSNDDLLTKPMKYDSHKCEVQHLLRRKRRKTSSYFLGTQAKKRAECNSRRR
mmetsp:Transcript_11421/g.17563  ORF Transcript_11421/g.17563 Transcript_11421/m.17563 type:complete len:280 (+) Transcript_11421:356-1195(+)|eukprot:CAMPEP_0178910320 /NCGR_PEP_ID=MMETSP0786-20121207/9033_1 /TAXON_ID=186022 /ORGANISM="Thalassionema frauenfeldii, Strain CCMP 1798" /LENGTH=279 /DNA_ID=CAMNT_0020582561 /DNA_START=265 /DNA_END=1104 /DNA_ORIENTATION=-